MTNSQTTARGRIFGLIGPTRHAGQGETIEADIAIPTSSIARTTPAIFRLIIVPAGGIITEGTASQISDLQKLAAICIGCKNCGEEECTKVFLR